MWTYSDLYKEISEVLLECIDVLVEAEQTFNKHLELGTESETKEIEQSRKFGQTTRVSL